MTTGMGRTATLGDLIAAVFDEAARFSVDPMEVSRLATQAVWRLLRRAGRATLAPPPVVRPTSLAAPS